MVAEDVVKRVTAQFVIAKYRLQGEDGFSEDKTDIQHGWLSVFYALKGMAEE